MDPEFQRALTVVLIVGSLIAVGATVVLYFIFRAFGGEKAGQTNHMVLIAGLVTFLLAVSVALYVLSKAGQ